MQNNAVIDFIRKWFNGYEIKDIKYDVGGIDLWTLSLQRKQ